MKNITKILLADIWFHIFAITSLALIIISFFIPPMGIIDSSVFVAVGEIFGFASLWEVHIAVKKGIDAKVHHNNTTIEINNPDKLDNENIEE